MVNLLTMGCYKPGEMIWIKYASSGGICTDYTIKITTAIIPPNFAESCFDIKEVIKIKRKPEVCIESEPVAWSTDINGACPDILINGCSDGHSATVWYKIEVDSQATQLKSKIGFLGKASTIHSFYYGTCDSLIPLYSNAKLKDSFCFRDTLGLLNSYATVGLIKGV